MRNPRQFSTLSPAQVKMLQSIRDGNGPWGRVRGMSEYGGAQQTYWSLRRMGLIAADNTLTSRVQILWITSNLTITWYLAPVPAAAVGEHDSVTRDGTWIRTTAVTDQKIVGAVLAAANAYAPHVAEDITRRYILRTMPAGWRKWIVDGP